MLPDISGEFRLVDDPELIFTPSGVAVCKGRLAANSRKFDEETKEWKDDKVCWLRYVAFKKVAENIAESLTKGSLALFAGQLQTEQWEKDGEKKQAYTILVRTAGPSLAFKPSRILDTPARTSGGDAAGPPADDPWGTPAGGGDEPPF
jgi:single-strand DNA-binding protein